LEYIFNILILVALFNHNGSWLKVRVIRIKKNTFCANTAKNPRNIHKT